MNIKTGLNYFSFDVDFFEDEKIQFISAKFGIEGEITVIKLLCKIYREGYFIKWGEDESLLFSKKVGIEQKLMDNIIAECLKRQFFDKDLYEKHKILTSRGIQKRFFGATKKRKEVIACIEYLLLGQDDDILGQNVNILGQDDDILGQNVNILGQDNNVQNNDIQNNDIQDDDILGQNVNILGQNDDIFRQSKVKESKVKESKENKTSFVPTQIEFGLSQLLFSKILERKSDYKKPDLQKWARHIDLMIRIDKRDPEKIRQIIEWCQADDFWQNVILSTEKLRKQYDKIDLQMRGSREYEREVWKKKFLEEEEND